MYSINAKNEIMAHITEDVFSRKDIEDAAFILIPDFTAGRTKNLIQDMLMSGTIHRAGRNKYVKGNDKRVYSPELSDEASEILSVLTDKFPYLNFQIWELVWLNEFLNHLVATNRFFVNVENGGCEFVYTALSNGYRDRLLLKPTGKEIDYYSTENGIIIERLVSEAPSLPDHIPALETLIVELFAGKVLPSLISTSDYPDVLERMFSKYNVDQSRLFRYARRRNKDKKIAEYIKNNTSIKLVVEV